MAAGNPPLGGKVMRITQAARPQGKKVGIKRKDYVCLVKSIDCADVFAESQARALACGVRPAGLELMPLGVWELGQKSMNLVRQRWRSDGVLSTTYSRFIVNWRSAIRRLAAKSCA